MNHLMLRTTAISVIPADNNGINKVTNKKNGPFTITELEVWEVKFIE